MTLLPDTSGLHLRLRGGLLAACIALLVSPPTIGRADEQPMERVTLEQALERLESATPDALAARLQVADAEAQRLTAQLYQNPTFSADAGNLAVSRTTPPGLSPGQTIVTSIRLDQPLALWGKRHLRIDAASAGVAAAQALQADTLRILRAAVKDTFFRALHDERRLAFATGNQERYQKTVALSDRRFHSGDLSEADFRKIELEQLSYVTEHAEAARAVAESQQLLGRLVGTDHRVAPEGQLTSPTVDIGDEDMVALAMAHRPDLWELQRQRQQADLTLQLARRERYPDVTVGIDYTNSQFTTAGDNRNTMGFGFSVPLPLLNQNQGAIAQAEVALRQADVELAKAKLDIAREVQDGRARYQSAQQVLRTYDSGYLERANTVLGAAEAAYRVGGASLLELLDAERTYTAIQVDYLESLLAARTALTALETAVGTGLEGVRPEPPRGESR